MVDRFLALNDALREDIAGRETVRVTRKRVYLLAPKNSIMITSHFHGDRGLKAALSMS